MNITVLHRAGCPDPAEVQEAMQRLVEVCVRRLEAERALTERILRVHFEGRWPQNKPKLPEYVRARLVARIRRQGMLCDSTDIVTLRATLREVPPKGPEQWGVLCLVRHFNPPPAFIGYEVREFAHTVCKTDTWCVVDSDCGAYVT
jgi:hypothetical protein